MSTTDDTNAAAVGGSALTEQLGPLVERIGSPPDTHCWDDESAADCWSYSPQMVAELLDAERERLAAACWERRGHFASDAAARAFAELVRDGLA